jgi:transposase
LHWIYSTEKRKRDRYAREQSLLKVEHDLAGLTGKLNTRKLKTREQIVRSVEDIVQKRTANRFYHIDVQTVKEMHKVQLGKGRPSLKTQYKTTYKFLYTLSWTRNRKTLEQEKRVDGIFPILCTDPLLSAKQALTAYKYQPRLEKRFSQFKSVHHAAPTLFKKVERVEAMMCLFFMALMLQAVIEREVRLKMQNEDIDAIPIYPEHRRACHPTTAKIFDRFYDTSIYKLVEGNRTIKMFKDDLSAVQTQVLGLMGMTEESYWRNTGWRPQP